MSKKLLIISGPTATGKTALAVKLAQKYHGQLLSADSRQIYQGMDIGTGKDHPRDFPIHLIDIISPNLSFSVADYKKLVLPLISRLQSQSILPIIVGGSGQYIDAIVNPRPTFSIPPNFLLRFFLNKTPLSVLQILLKLLDLNTFRSLNHSDLCNPHRLIRKIEISLSPKSLKIGNLKLENFNSLHLSLSAPTSILYKNIDSRVALRQKRGLLNEIKNLLKSYRWSDPGLNTLSYKEFQPYFEKKSSLSDCILRWRFNEHAYARRQVTWFKKIKDIHFIDITQPDYYSKLSKIVDIWYNKP